MKNMDKQSTDVRKIGSYRELDGVMALLSYSMLCLVGAEHSEGEDKDEFVKLAMSVILPLVSD